MLHGNKLFGLSSLFVLLVTSVQADNPIEHAAQAICGKETSSSLLQNCNSNMVLNTSRQGQGDISGATANMYIYPQVPLDAEGYQSAPDDLQLEQVHVYVRHGERTPVGVRLAGPPASIPEHWNLCWAAQRFHDAVSTSIGSASNNGVQEHGGAHENRGRARRLVERRDGTKVEGECLLGELTDLGRQTTYNYGKNLRKIYIEKLGFLPDSLKNKDAVYFRSTNIPRTTESLQQIIHGLYPSDKCDQSTQPPLLIRNGKDENLIGNTYACKRLEMLQVGFAMAAAQAFNRNLEPLDKRLSKYLNGNPIRVDGKPRASGVMDTVRAAVAHGIRVPPEFEDKTIVDTIERAVVNEWFAGYKTEEVRRLGMGPLLSDMTRKMQGKIKFGEADPLKVLVHSTHDTAIAALTSTFDVFDEAWPAFTSSVTFELFRKRDQAPPSNKLSQIVLGRQSPDSPSNYYVRMRHQNKNMTLPLCAPEGKHLEGHPELCTFAVFKARVDELTPVNWEEECSASGRA